MTLHPDLPSDNPAVIPDYHIRPHPHSFKQALRRILRKPVVTVRKLYILPPCHTHSQIPALRHTGILLAEYADPYIQLPILLQYLFRVIRTSIIHRENLDLFIGLAQNAAQTPLQSLFPIIDWNDDTHQRLFHFDLLLAAFVLRSILSLFQSGRFLSD